MSTAAINLSMPYDDDTYVNSSQIIEDDSANGLTNDVG